MSTFHLTLWQPTRIPATLCRPFPVKRRSSLPTGASGAATGCLYGYGATTVKMAGTGWMKDIGNTYEYTGYSASISGEMSLMPDDIVPTASGKTMKSGYGVKTEVRATLSTDAPTSHITYPQTAFSVFPEFQYQTYLRLLQRSGGQSAKFIFKPNEFSTYDRTVHFTPLWFPDATDYTIYTQVWDTWTPDGMLSINLNDYVSIQGSLYDDWYTNRE